MKGKPARISRTTAYPIDTRIASAAIGVRRPGSSAIPADHMENAERKHSQTGVFIAVDHVLRLRSLGQPWRIKQKPKKRRRTRSDTSVADEGPEGTRNSTTIRSITESADVL
jgi:hypothetical protein